MATTRTLAKFQLALLEENVKEKLATSTLVAASHLVDELNRLDIEPAAINKSEEGICFTFCNARLSLYVELYNNGEMGYIINDNTTKTAVENEDLEKLENVVNKIKDFLKL